MSFPPRPDAAATGSLPGQGFVLAPDEGDPWWWLGSLNLVKLPGSATSGGLDIVEHRVPAGYAPPPHVHARQDEVFYILDGQFTVRCGERTWQAGAGSLVFLPRGVPHGFVVSGDAPGRTLLINSPAGFAEVVRGLGEPATELALPGPDVPVPDPERIAAVAAAHGITPPPAPWLPTIQS